MSHIEFRALKSLADHVKSWEQGSKGSLYKKMRDLYSSLNWNIQYSEIILLFPSVFTLPNVQAILTRCKVERLRQVLNRNHHGFCLLLKPTTLRTSESVEMRHQWDDEYHKKTMKAKEMYPPSHGLLWKPRLILSPTSNLTYTLHLWNSRECVSR